LMRKLQLYRQQLAYEKGKVYRDAYLSTPDYIINNLKQKCDVATLERERIFSNEEYIYLRTSKICT